MLRDEGAGNGGDRTIVGDSPAGSLEDSTHLVRSDPVLFHRA
jgi:hypothetical protein